MPDSTPDARRLVGVSAGFLALSEGVTVPLLTTSSGPRTETAGESESSTPSGAPSVIFEGEMPSLQELLEQNRVAYAFLELDASDSRFSSTESLVWTVLVGLAIVWGGVVGLAFASDDFLVGPTTAIFGILAISTLVLTVRAASGGRRKKSRR